MTTDALLGGLENLRYEVGVLMEHAQDSHPEAAEALQFVDDDLFAIMAKYEEDEELFLSEEEAELHEHVLAGGVFVPTEYDDLAEEE
jgi:hypothetical protein